MNRLYRSRRDKWLTGLIGGLAEYFGISSTILRILIIICVPITSGAAILIYLIASLVISKEPYQPYDPYYNSTGGWNGGGYGGGYGGNPGGPGGPGFGGNPGGPGGPGYGYGGPRPPQPPYQGANQGNSFNGNTGAGFGGPPSSNLDSMMEDIEKKAMEKELEDLRKKLSKYEKGEV